MNIPFCLPYIDKDVENEVFSCLNETGWLTTGPKVKEFENQITELCQTNFTICVNSWTSGLLLLIKWLNLDCNDEIIVPTYTYSATSLAVINSNVKCVFVDVSDDFTLDLNQVKKAINERTKAIIPVDLGGYPADYTNLNRLLESDSVRKLFKPKSEFQKKIGRPVIISDAAHSIGSTINNKPTPLFSDFSIFSFHSVKNITTGEGGAITFKVFNKIDDKLILEELKLLSLNGQTKSAFEKNTIGGWKYDIKTNGLKINMPDINAAIGLAQIKKYKKILLPEREFIFKTYNRYFSNKSWAILPPFERFGRKSSCHLYQLRIKGFSEGMRNKLIMMLSNEGIGVNVHYIPLPMLTFFKKLELNITEYPKSYELYSNEISLPIYNNLSIENVKYISLKLIELTEKILKT